jgi:hypothetical protein
LNLNAGELGGILCVIFFATDYSTSPVHRFAGLIGPQIALIAQIKTKSFLRHLQVTIFDTDFSTALMKVGKLHLLSRIFLLLKNFIHFLGNGKCNFCTGVLCIHIYCCYF